MDAIQGLSKFVAETRYEQISPKAIEITKYSILDTLGCTLAGGTAGAACKEIVELVQDGGGKPESTVLAHQFKVPAWMAAFANGAMSHALDFDDVDDASAIHPGVGTVPAALAMAERLGHAGAKVSGKDFVTAVCLGEEMLLRLGYAGKKGQGSFKWLPGQLYGYFGATASCGRLLGLKAEQLIDAFGITLMQVSGTYEPIMGTGGVIRGIWPAFSSKAGVLSALMASKGISGSKDSLEGRAALYASFLDNQYDREHLFQELGTRYYVANSGFKPWPCSGLAKPFIEGTLKLVQDHDLKPEDVAGITLGVSDFAQLLVDPLDVRREPKTTMDSKWSLPYIVAAAVVHRRVGIANFTAEGIRDAKVLALAKRVDRRHDADLTGGKTGWTGIPPGRVEITTTSGQTLKLQVDVALGYGDNPMLREHHIAKFRDCAAYSARKLPESDVDGVIEMIERIESLADVSEIARVLA